MFVIHAWILVITHNNQFDGFVDHFLHRALFSSCFDINFLAATKHITFVISK